MGSNTWWAYFNPNNLSVKALLTQAAVWIVLGNLTVLGAFVVSNSLANTARLESEQARLPATRSGPSSMRFSNWPPSRSDSCGSKTCHWPRHTVNCWTMPPRMSMS